MSLVAFDRLSRESRLWIYGINRLLNGTQKQLLSDEMDRFIEQWTAHKVDLNAGWQLLHGRFIVIAADESTTSASGCSIDSLVQKLRELETTLAVEIINSNAKVFYRDENNDIVSDDRSGFSDSVASGLISEDTSVFDNTIPTAGDVRDGVWEKPFNTSWHWDIYAKYVQS